MCIKSSFFQLEQVYIEYSAISNRLGFTAYTCVLIMPRLAIVLLGFALQHVLVLGEDTNTSMDENTNTSMDENTNTSMEGICVNSYSELKNSLLSTPGNSEELLSAFFPVGKASPDVVNVTYILCCTKNASAFENESRTSNDSDFSVGVANETTRLNYTWTDNSLFLYIDPTYFQMSTVWLFQLRKSSLRLTVNPFCTEYNLTDSSKEKMLLTLTSRLKAYAVTNLENAGSRGYAAVRDESPTGMNGVRQYVGGLIVGTLFTMFTSVALLLTVAWFLINWEDNFLASLVMLSVVITLALFAVFAFALDVALVAMYAEVPYYISLSSFPVYFPVIFFFVIASSFTVGFLLDRQACSKKMLIVAAVTGALSATVPSLCARLFWMGLASLLYPVRVGSVFLVIAALAFGLIFSVVTFLLLLCSMKQVEGAMEFEFKVSHAVMTALLTCVISFLLALLSAYVSTISVINAEGGDPVTSLVTILFPVVVGLATVWFLPSLVVRKKKKKQQAPTPPVQKSKSRDKPAA